MERVHAATARRIATKGAWIVASSPIWSVTYFACRTTLAPILITLSRVGLGPRPVGWDLRRRSALAPAQEFVAFSQVADAEQECADFRRRSGTIIKLITVWEILDQLVMQKM